MNNKSINTLMENLSLTGCDKFEIYYEQTFKKNYSFYNNELESINNYNTNGLGITLFDEYKSYFGSITNFKKKKELSELIETLKKNILFKNKTKYILGPLKSHNNKYIDKDINYKKDLFSSINDFAKGYDKRIKDINITLFEKSIEIRVINNEGINIKEKRNYLRLFIKIIAEDQSKKSTSYFKYVSLFGLETNIELLKKDLIEACDEAIKSLYAEECPSGEFPVIIGNDFGGVLFHEACGHSLEATSLSNNTSVLASLKGKLIASKKVTLIDDSTIKGQWGTTYFDDEGYKTKKRVLIKNGILTEYLINNNLSKKLNETANNCGRRESYEFASTSRMSNTYLKCGKDSFDDMIKSIKFGIYAKSMGGGSVSPSTGNFNFSVSDAYLIENGKITNKVKGASLIGNTIDLLKNVEMVSNDLKYCDGYCGSLSGQVPVTVGMPTVKVTKMIVGGTKSI